MVNHWPPQVLPYMHPYLHLKLSDDVVCEGLCLYYCELEGAMLLRPHLRPVTLALCPCVLLEVGHHGNSPHPFLPDHPPEVSDGVRERSWYEGGGGVGYTISTWLSMSQVVTLISLP